MKVGESRVGKSLKLEQDFVLPRGWLLLRRVQKGGFFWHCKGVNLDAQKQCTGLAYGKSKALMGLGCDYPP